MYNTNRTRTDSPAHDITNTDLSKLTHDELDELADDLYHASKYPVVLVTGDALNQYADETPPKPNNLTPKK
jgi:hypothetical protein